MILATTHRMPWGFMSPSLTQWCNIESTINLASLGFGALSSIESKYAPILSVFFDIIHQICSSSLTCYWPLFFQTTLFSQNSEGLLMTRVSGAPSCFVVTTVFLVPWAQPGCGSVCVCSVKTHLWRTIRMLHNTLLNDFCLSKMMLFAMDIPHNDSSVIA